jgi:aminoglycoside 3-N-acetyltransferase
MAVRLRDLLLGLRELHLGNAPVIVHSSLKSFGEVEGGAQTVVNALAGVFPVVLVPTFTHKTMLIPLAGPEHNAMTYGSGESRNRMAEFFTPRMPVDPLMGIIPETLRNHPNAKRSIHPIQSFAGINADGLLKAQTMAVPLGPLAALEKAGGWVVLMGVNHTVNTSIHYAEKLAGRLQFVRWALLSNRVTECGGFPGCSDGFNQIEPVMEDVLRSVQIGGAKVQAIPLQPLIQVVVDLLMKDSQALLCQRPDCERCNAVRQSVHLQEV